VRIDVVTIFPDYLKVLDLSLIGKAADRGPLDLHVHDLRDHAHDRHRTVDDTPLGGGAGMVMKPDVWGEALDEVLAVDTPDAPPQGLIAPPPANTEHGRFPVSFYLVGMTFIIFDVEVVFLYPWATAFGRLGFFGLGAAVLFIGLITVPYILEWRRGGLDWD